MKESRHKPSNSVKKYGNRCRRAAIALTILLLSPAAIVAQSQQGAAEKGRRVGEQLEDEFTEKVSLAPAELVSLLRREPGLLLEAKKILVQKAYEQGRLLEESELTDDALFRLLYRDANIRALVTQQVIKRGYVRPLPVLKESGPDVDRDSSKDRLQEADGDSTAKPARKGMESRGSERFRTEKRTGKEGSDENGRDRNLPSVHPDELPKLLENTQDSAGGVRPEESGPQFSGPGSSVSGSNDALTGSFGPAPRASTVGAEAAMDSRYPQATREPELRGNSRKSKESASSPVASSSIDGKRVPYRNLPALRDLYTQVSPSQPLERFGADIFKNGTGNLDDLPMDLPLGPDYVLGPGDGLNIELWGGISQRVQRVVDREGRVALPEVGTIMVAGKSLAAVQEQLQVELRREFHDVRVDVSVSRLRSIRVYVVGDVEYPGPYDVSAISSPLNAIYMAGGPTERGSIRTIKHFRGKQLVQEVDSYDLVLRGASSTIQRLQSGDTILVPPIGPEVSVEGMVRRPAIYELRGESNLEEVLDLAGGALPSASLSNIEVDRLDPHQKRSMLHLALPDTTDPATVSKAFTKFAIHEGDKIRITAIRPVSDRAIFLDGHVFRPGKYSYADGMKVKELLERSGELLPEPYYSYAEVIRVTPPAFRPQVIAFNLRDALSGDPAANLALQPLDTVRIYGRFDFEDDPRVIVSGEVREPGEKSLSGDMTLRDAIFAAGGLTPDAAVADAQVFRQQGGQTKILSVDLRQALAGNEASNITLMSRDRIVVHKNLAKLDPAAVYVHGEVANPGKYPLGEHMTVSQLVRLAGGFKRGAYTAKADLSRFTEFGGESIRTERIEVNLDQAFSDRDADTLLKDGDTLSVRQVTGFNDLGAAIQVEGEVLHPSTYGIGEGERLSSILLRAGGFRPGAYPQGAVLERAQVRELEEKSREDMVRRLDEEEQAMKVMPNLKPQEELAFRQAFLQQHALILSKLKSAPAIGRVVVRLSSNIAEWQNTPDDIEVRAGDLISIPKRPDHVLVTGQVYNPTAVTYRPGKSARWYLSQSGGATALGNSAAIFVIRANGTVIGNGGGTSFWSGDSLKTVLNPGDVVVVPEKILTGNSVLKSLADSAQILSAIAIAVSVGLR